MSDKIKIFLASSLELKEDRDEFEKFIGRKNKVLIEQDVFIELVIWDDFIDHVSETSLQDEYNKEVQACDIFVMLFWSKVGPYTLEEFETAYKQFKNKEKPLIYTYQKDVSMKPDDRKGIKSLWNFQDRLEELGHFPSKYQNTGDLINQFNGQLEKLDLRLKITESVSMEEIVSKYWQQLADDPEYNSMPVIGSEERRQLNDLYVRLQITSEGSKTRVEGKLREKLTDKTYPDGNIPHELAPDQALNHFRRMVILGSPGIGKTTMFRYIACTVSLLGLGLARPDEFKLNTNKKLIPLYLPLPYLDEFEGNLIDCLKCYLDARLGCKELISNLDALLCDGRCLLLLDGLDEVTSARLRDVKIKIQGVLNNPNWRDNYIMISCREASWEKNDPSFVVPAVLQVKDMDEKAIGAYLRKWFGDKNISDPIKLKNTICNNPGLSKLATNPFLLSLIAWLSQDDDLPERRVDLYGTCTEALLRETHKSETERHKSQFGPDHDRLKEGVLSDVAFAMMQKNVREISRNELWELIHKSLGSDKTTDIQPGKLIDEIHTGSSVWREISKERVYMFKHNTFREYYAAKKLAQRIDELLAEWSAESSNQSFSDYFKTASHEQSFDPFQWINDPLWNEVYRLTVALLDKPTPVLEFLFSINPTLAARCYLDANPEKVNHDVIKRCWTQDIERGERVEMVQGIQDALKDPREVVDFIDAVFRTAETDTEVLYHCDVVLARIDTAEATRVRNTMFDHWHEDRTFSPADFENDDYWKFADIDAGEFQMGGDEYDEEKPIHPVKLSAFRLGCYAVTVEQYHRFDPGHRKNRLDDEFGENERQPVVRVSWYDAYIFCKWAGCRLPSEAEWEYACRAGTATPFNTGDNLTTEQANYDGNDPYKNYPKGKYVGKTTTVGSYPPNDRGLFDMHGNVWEWCRDWYDETYYADCKKQGVVENPQGPETGSSRVLRGGCWFSYAYDCRSALRNWFNPVLRNYNFGFRVIQDSPQ